MPSVPDPACRKACPPDAPFPHGPFLVDGDGGLHPRAAPSLRFAWRGRRCEARLAGGRMRLTATAGAIPYTAESPGQRAGTLAAIGALPADLPAGWRLSLLPDHRLRLETEAPLPAPTTATALVGRMVGFVLALDPYLDRLESAGAAGPPSADRPGMVKT
jgi:hypothetical protein